MRSETESAIVYDLMGQPSYACRMSTAPDYMYRMSEALSEVMGDIGVTEELVMKRRTSCDLNMTLERLCEPLLLKGTTKFCFGSQSEGSTTFGLRSDIDKLFTVNFVNVIQCLSEWKPGSLYTFKMIQNENISPSYCCLQVISRHIPCPATAKDSIKNIEKSVIDSEGRVLMVNTWISTTYTTPEHSPALTSPGSPDEYAIDIVPSFRCKSSPLQATPWLRKLKESKWPSEDDKRSCRNAGCFVVSTSSKLSDTPEYEWRISTSLQERCLVLCLNITQLRCYVLMKMVLKTHIHPYVEDVLSSFMCKNVLLYCVYNSSHESSQEWHTGNLLSYLQLCLFMLKECILQRNCPHLMIPGNNLLAGHMSDAQREQLLDIIDNLMEDKEELLYKIQIDDLGTRLMMKLNILPSSQTLLSATKIANGISGEELLHIAWFQSTYQKIFLTKMYKENLEVTQQFASELLSYLVKKRDADDSIQQTACDYLIPLVKSILGSVMACISIDARTAISDEAFSYLEAGKEYAELSGSLKLVSVLYCTGNIEKAKRELKISQCLYILSMVIYIPCCFPRQQVPDKVGCLKVCDDHNEGTSIFILAVCTKFLKNEISCVPHELRYEILKSYIEEDRKMRTEDDSWWMDFIAVDSVPYLYFLQYRTYGRLQRRKEQKEALLNLVSSVGIKHCLNHHETFLNLLGQCFEQENMQAVAFQYYIQSLQHRERNNAARFLMCIQLFKLWKKYNV